MTEVTITFKVPHEVYHDYEGLLDEFLNGMEEVGAEDIDVKELQ